MTITPYSAILKTEANAWHFFERGRLGLIFINRKSVLSNAFSVLILAEERKQQNSDGDDDKQMLAVGVIRSDSQRTASVAVTAAAGGESYCVLAIASSVAATASGIAVCIGVVAVLTAAITVIITIGVCCACGVSAAVASIVCHK